MSARERRIDVIRETLIPLRRKRNERDEITESIEDYCQRAAEEVEIALESEGL